MVEMSTDRRNTGLDIVRIICCLGVIGYHTIDDIPLVGIAKFLYFSCSFCVPGFFVLSGYLMGCKTDLSVDYCEKKIFSLLKKAIGWIVFWIIIHLFLTGEVYDVWDNIEQSFLSSGVLPVAWYLFTYSIILIFAPGCFVLFKKYSKVFCFVSILWMIVLATGALDYYREQRTQALWIDLYLGYYLLGMICSRYFALMKEKSKLFVGISLLLFFTTSFVYFIKVYNIKSDVMPHQFYGEWYYSIWLLSIFYLSSVIVIKKNHWTKLLKRLSDNSFSVYLGHLPLLLYMTSINPLGSLSSAIVCSVILFITTQIMSEVFRKLPLLRNIV